MTKKDYTDGEGKEHFYLEDGREYIFDSAKFEREYEAGKHRDANPDSPVIIVNENKDNTGEKGTSEGAEHDRKDTKPEKITGDERESYGAAYAKHYSQQQRLVQMDIGHGNSIVIDSATGKPPTLNMPAPIDDETEEIVALRDSMWHADTGKKKYGTLTTANKGR